MVDRRGFLAGIGGVITVGATYEKSEGGVYLPGGEVQPDIEVILHGFPISWDIEQEPVLGQQFSGMARANFEFQATDVVHAPDFLTQGFGGIHGEGLSGWQVTITRHRW